MALITCPTCKFFFYHDFDGDLNSVMFIGTVIRQHQAQCPTDLNIKLECKMCNLECTRDPNQFFMDHSHGVERVLYIYGSESSSDDSSIDDPQI